MGDMTTKDVLDRYVGDGQKKPTDQHYGDSDDFRPPDKWAFAVFSTSLTSALPLPTLIDPSTDEVRPSETMLDLIGDPKTSQFQIFRE